MTPNIKHILRLILVFVVMAFLSYEVGHPHYWARRSVAPVLQTIYPTFSACGRCGLPWSVCKGHNTTYHKSEPEQRGEMTFFTSRSCFPLCERCWTELETPQARMPYYEKLIIMWQEHGAKQPEVADEIRESVLAGN